MIETSTTMADTPLAGDVTIEAEWEIVRSRPFGRAIKIGEAELPAELAWIRVLCASGCCYRHEILDLGTNQGCVCIMGAGRGV